MPNATKALDTQYREDCDYFLVAASNQTFFKGTMVATVNTGFGGSGVNLAPNNGTSHRVVGVYMGSPDDVGNTSNTSGFKTQGGERIIVRRGCHRFKNDGSIVSHVDVGSVCYAADDQTVGLGGLYPAGIIEQVDPDGWVWVDFSFSRSGAQGGGID